MAKPLHLIQAGVENGDKAWIERAARRGLTSSPDWVAPKTAAVGDDVVVFIGGFGFFATGRVLSEPRPRRNWPSRYGAAIGRIRLINPAISLATIRRKIPELTWAVYPRSITTPSQRVAERIRTLVADRRRTGLPDLSREGLEGANIDELRRVALLRAASSVKAHVSNRLNRVRAEAIRRYVLRRANGRCEACGADAPFERADGSPYLEPHHVARLADDGPDHPAKVIGLCPNCHRRSHHSIDAKQFNGGLIKRLRRIERAG
jgi:5-methylcytosine-specific restriction endonuclease McrA